MTDMEYNHENPIYPRMTFYESRMILDIQQKLKAICTYLHRRWAVIPENGEMDDDTREAIKDFQKWQYQLHRRITIH